jgi:Spy/CpxP family protein refolding chaperone
MKRTFQVVSAALLLTVASVTAQAQGGGGGGGGGRGMGGGRGGWEQQKTMLLKDITLTPQQTTSVDSIGKVFTDKQTELRAGMQAGGGGEEVMAKMRALGPERNEAIKKLLTPDQAKQFDANVAAMPAGRGRGGF